MKKLLLLILITTSVTCFSQTTNPDLFQTWYLRNVQDSDLGTLYEVSEIEPSIIPTLTIIDDLNFTGEGACNTFEGVFDDPSSGDLEPTQFSHTTTNCNIQIHDYFEDSYFGFMQYGGWYSITSDSQGLVLKISNPIMGGAVFKNYMLNSKEFELNQIKIYPIPSDSRIFLASHHHIITKIEFMNSLGQIISTIKEDFEMIDISNLTSGIYFMNITTELGVTTKQVIKK